MTGGSMSNEHRTQALPERREPRDRRRSCRYVLVDRRSGFDRRRRYPVLDLMRDDAQLLPALVLVNLLSLGDGVLTWIGLKAAVISEGNPVLASLLAANPYAAAAFKVIVIALVSLGIWHGRRYRAILGVTIFALVTYTAVLAYHAATIVMIRLA